MSLEGLSRIDQTSSRSDAHSQTLGPRYESPEQISHVYLAQSEHCDDTSIACITPDVESVQLEEPVGNRFAIKVERDILGVVQRRLVIFLVRLLQHNLFVLLLFLLFQIFIEMRVQ